MGHGVVVCLSVYIYLEYEELIYWVVSYFDVYLARDY
jgi:hypothetical protein